MSALGLSSRAIIGRMYNRLDIGPAGWVEQVGMRFQSDQPTETYKWLGMAPAMREWLGGRHPKGFRENGITIANKTYEATLEVLLDELNYDKTGQINVRIGELARRANSHWATLLSTLILAGATGLAYDGQYFFDTDHAEGSSGSQSNSITFDLSDDGAAVPAANQGTYLIPSAAIMALAILKAIQQIYSFVDDQAEPMNENLTQFHVQVPVPYMQATAGALSLPAFASGMTNPLDAQDKFSIDWSVNPRLTWTDKFAVYCTEGETKPFILQEEQAVKVSAQAEGSPEEFMHRRHLYGIDAKRNVGYGFWQKACLVTLQA